MIEQEAVVVQVEGEFALVEAQRESSCGQCGAQKTCGTGVLAKSIGKRAMRIKVLNRCDAQPGDAVVVGMPESGFLKSAFMTYLLPLILMLLGAIIAYQLTLASGVVQQEGFTILGAITGFILALWLLKRYAKKIAQDPSVHPVALRKSKPQIAVSVVQPDIGQQKF